MRLSLSLENAAEDADAVSEKAAVYEDMAELPEIGGKKAKKAWRARLRRREKIQRVAYDATGQWQQLAASQPAVRPPEIEAPVQQFLARPQGLGLSKKEKGEEPHSTLPPPREVPIKAGVFRSSARLLVWISAGCLFGLGVFSDWLCRRNTIENRARRLRKTFEKMGPTFIKVGQQLSMRLDLLPYAYTHELEKMLDKVPAFRSEHAIRAIERTTGKSLEEVFSAFDPDPIGSASVACVFQGILRSGERVAVKVRRPGIGPRLAADMRALGWLVLIAELLFLPPRFTANFIFELRTMLMEELDFRREARFADLYRRRMRKTRQLRFVSVPRVFFGHSSDEIMVTEFVTGIWLTEILQAIETQDSQARDKLEEMNIDHIILARRIQLIARFNNFENIFFHADLHPANILIQPGNKIILIDFGSCGSFSKKELNSWRRWFDAQSIDDVGGMVQAALGIIEPLPPINRDEFGQRLESMFWNDLYAIKSKHSHWAERISSRLWMGFLKLSQEFHIPMRLNTLRMIRASMLSDTIAARLDNDQDPYQEFRHYEKGAGKRAKKRAKKRLHRLVGPGKFIRIEQGIESALKIVYQVQRTVDSLASIRIGSIITKTEYIFSLLLRYMVWLGLSAATLTFWRWMFHRHDTIKVAFFYVLKDSNLWHIMAAVPILLVFWRVHFRLKEPEPWD